MKASELITKLQEMIAQHGDHEVYSECDWGFVGPVRYEVDRGRSQHPFFVLEEDWSHK